MYTYRAHQPKSAGPRPIASRDVLRTLAGVCDELAGQKGRATVPSASAAAAPATRRRDGSVLCSVRVRALECWRPV
eukprot:scaffold1741_cov409-Prasinococcus_capsulatus_cf.AAC.13